MQGLTIVIIIMVLALIMIGITIALDKLFEGVGAIKYLPYIVTLVVGITYLIKALFYAEVFEDIGYMLVSVISFSASIVALTTVGIIDFIKRKEQTITTDNES